MNEYSANGTVPLNSSAVSRMQHNRHTCRKHVTMLRQQTPLTTRITSCDDDSKVTQKNRTERTEKNLNDWRKIPRSRYHDVTGYRYESLAVTVTIQCMQAPQNEKH